MKQKTLRSSLRMVGTGLHSGAGASVEIFPAPVDHGIVFRVSHGNNLIDIDARATSITDVRYNTSLAAEGAHLYTVEHILSALRGLGIDNALIRCRGGEIPAMDGSAYPFVSNILKVGLRTQDAPRKYITILKPIKVGNHQRRAELWPAQCSMFTATIDFEHPLLSYQSMKLKLTPQNYTAEIARARTFGFIEDYKHLTSNGLALGATLDNSITLGKNGSLLNQDGLRYADEFIRHKILDAIGDLSLLRYPILGEYRGLRSGHSLHKELMAELLESPQSWKLSIPEYSYDAGLPSIDEGHLEEAI